MVRIAFCDDEREIIEKYERIIAQFAKHHKIEVEFFKFLNGETLLFHLNEMLWQIDIVFLDIYMGETNGMETARTLRAVNSHVQIVFLTSSEEFVYDAFDVGAVQYLLKDRVSPAQMEAVFLQAVQRVSQQKEELFVCEFDGIKKMIPIEKIVYFDIWKRLVTVYYGENETAKFYASMEQLEQQFADENFVRVHRSYLVHLPYIAQVQSRKLLLKTGAGIPLGGTYQESFKREFSRYISRFQFYELPSRAKQEGGS